MTGKLVVWDQQYANTKGWSKVMDEATAAFEAAHKGVTIQHVAQTTDPVAYTQLLQAAFQAKAGPDIVMMQPAGDGVYIYKGALAPLEGYVAPALVKSMVGTADVSADGHLYGLPDGIQGMVIFYNKALFAKAGLDPNKPPTTVQEFMTDSAALKAAGITPIGSGNATGGDLMVWAYSTFNPSVATAKQALEVGQNKIKFTDPTVMDTMQKVVDIYKAGDFSAKINSQDLTAGAGEFTHGKAGMTIGIATILTYVADGNGDATVGGIGADNVGVIPTLGSPANYVPVGANVAWVVPKYSQHQKLASEYISYLSSVKVQQEMFNNFGWLPSNSKVDTTGGPAVKYPAMADMLKELLKAPVTQLPGHQLWKAPVATEFKKQMQTVLGGSASLKDAMAAVQAVQDQQG